MPGDTVNDAHQYLREGFFIDDDTQQNNENLTTTVHSATYQAWGWDGIDPHKQGNNQRTAPIFNEDPGRPIDKANLLLTLFLTLLPWDYFTKVVLPETNKSLTTKVTVGELLKFIGLWLVMATTEGNKRDDFWSSKPVSIFEGALYRFNSIMSGRRFNLIVSSLKLTASPPPSFQDRFY